MSCDNITVSLPAEDAIELAELLEFLADWIEVDQRWVDRALMALLGSVREDRLENGTLRSSLRPAIDRRGVEVRAIVHRGVAHGGASGRSGRRFGYDAAMLQADLHRFAFLLGGTNPRLVFGHDEQEADE